MAYIQPEPEISAQGEAEGRGMYIRLIHQEALVYTIYSIANRYI